MIRNHASEPISHASVVWNSRNIATLRVANPGCQKRVIQPAASESSAEPNAHTMNATFAPGRMGENSSRWVSSSSTSANIGRCMCVTSSMLSAERGGRKLPSSPR